MALRGTPRAENAATGGTLAGYFELARYRVTVSSEVLAGLTTFLVMAYIAFVNPSILTSRAYASKLGYRPQPLLGIW
jgi:xanthine/uracil/vitamin C permease (AzgA family)